ncbi:hypothetical protein DPMN_110615 [Dreissena polymorpha]|uniref:Uncharacterized protein n=1 Tax=Dreissena polymorpha TaxID=45954 RepID=A0A9D4KD00_DREPO|nr:hypothetical protein DPMN_110615 [Dreissena polymorpha]
MQTSHYHNHNPSISICGRPISNLRFTDDIYLLAGTSSEFQELINIPLKSRRIRHGGCKDNLKIMGNSTINNQK